MYLLSQLLCSCANELLFAGEAMLLKLFGQLIWFYEIVYLFAEPFCGILQSQFDGGDQGFGPPSPG